MTLLDYDSETGVVRATMEELGSMLAECEALARDTTDARLAGAMEAAARPRCRLEVQKDEVKATCWIDSRSAALLVPRGAGRGELWMLGAGAVPAAVAGILQLGPRSPAKTGARLPAASLAAMLAGSNDRVPVRTPVDPWVREALAGLAAHWRVDSRWASEHPPVRRSVEAIDCAEGLWLVIPDGPDLVLEPAVTSELWRRLAALFPRA